MVKFCPKVSRWTNLPEVIIHCQFPLHVLFLCTRLFTYVGRFTVCIFCRAVDDATARNGVQQGASSRLSSPPPRHHLCEHHPNLDLTLALTFTLTGP